MTREERIAQIQPLRDQGLTYRQISERLGLSYQYTKRILNPSYDSTQVATRNAKQRRTGTCADCGATTRYNGRTQNGASLRCNPCASAAAGLARRGTGPVTERALAFLEQPRRCSELRDHLGVSNGYVSQLLDRLHRLALVTRISRGVYQRTDAL
jgi:hypothetical protein